MSHSQRRPRFLGIALPLLAALAWLLTATAALPAETPAPLVSWDFEQGVLPWLGLDPRVHLEQTTAPGSFAAGTAALEVQYDLPVGVRAQDALFGPVVVLPRALPELTAVRLSVKTSLPTNLAVAAMEANRSIYFAPFFSAGGTWQIVELSLNDFLMVEDAKTPRDPNGQLDPGEITGLGVLDLSALLSQLTQELPGRLFTPGPRRLWLDDVSLLRTAPPPGTLPEGPDTGGAVLLDACDRPTFRWLVVGGKDVEVRSVPGEREDPGAYEVAYSLPPGTLFALGKAIPTDLLAGTQALHLSVSSSRPLTLYLFVEQRDKQRFTWTVELPGGGEVNELSPPWDAFEPERRDVEQPTRLDPGMIAFLALADVSGVMNPGAAETTTTALCLDNLYASK